MKFLTSLVLNSLLIFVLSHHTGQSAQAQSLNVVAGNTLISAATGAALGGAGMALANSTSHRPVMVGVGFGTLFGFGIGIYDAATIAQGGTVNGFFNTAPFSGAIIFMDTIYGAGTGALLGMAIALIGDNPILNGVQYGAGAGAFAGFAFGLYDAFYLASHGSGGNGDFFDYAATPSATASPSEGLLTLGSFGNTRISALQPAIYSQTAITPNGNLTAVNQSAGLEMLRFSARF
ncbi:hypothetical protein CYPRO_1063 [Cyclonatronum proteinivorum]|uniref:Uncharacterized protein n=1 Tax=Cyclonatronum proteinivorum TaxID=1457365 RepID=A0A345UIM6_9BACT|nr:hypothetical protein [Cyclonatronum proteinivorum]AXJ00328.1 hypothetical protein CYPRO_1063 [Cyclonatronum proteinivorum]